MAENEKDIFVVDIFAFWLGTEFDCQIGQIMQYAGNSTWYFLTLLKQE